MTPGSLWDVEMCATLVADVSPVSTLQTGDWFSAPARHYFLTYITTLDQHQDLAQHVCLNLSE